MSLIAIIFKYIKYISYWNPTELNNMVIVYIVVLKVL